MLYQAVRVIAVYLLFSSVLLGILKESPFKQYARMFAGLLLVFMLLRSVFVFSPENAWDLETLLHQVSEQADFQERLWEADEYGIDRIEETFFMELEEQVKELAREYGYECRKVEAGFDEEYQIGDMRIKLTQAGENADEKGLLAALSRLCQVEPEHIDIVIKIPAETEAES